MARPEKDFELLGPAVVDDIVILLLAFTIATDLPPEMQIEPGTIILTKQTGGTGTDFVREPVNLNVKSEHKPKAM